MTDSLQKFIEDHIQDIREGEYGLLCYQALMQHLVSADSKQLYDILKDVFHVDAEAALKQGIIEWCKDNIALLHRRKIAVTKLTTIVPHFGIDGYKFRQLFIDCCLTAYPNKKLSADSYGIDYFEERR